MTDHLEQDLRTMLAERAAAVTTEAAAGEIAIAERLLAGDHGLAGAVADGSSPSRRPWALAAAAAAAAVVIAVLVLREDDATVRSGPVATDPTVPIAPASVLEFRPVLASGPCDALGPNPTRGADDGLCYDLGDPLPGNELLLAAGVYQSFSSTGTPIGGDATSSTTSTTVMEEFGVQLQLTDDGIEQLTALAEQCAERVAICPTGQLAIVVDGIVFSAPMIQDPSFASGEVLISGDFTEDEATALAAALTPREGTSATTGPPASDDLTLGGGGDAAKDVAERVALTVFGDEYVTTAVDPGRDSYLVTMEGPDGSTVAADVMGLRVLSIVSPELAHTLSDGLEVRDGVATVAVPMPGTLTLVGLDDSLSPVGSTPPTVVDGNTTTVITDVEPWLTDAVWVWLSVETADGQVLQAFGAAPSST